MTIRVAGAVRAGRAVRLAVASIALGAATVALSPAAQPAHAESVTVPELFGCVGDPQGCAYAQDASEWALGTARAKYDLESLHNGAGDAFRHCIWAGALTQRAGADRAYQILQRHEDAAPDEPLDERVMDMGNNSIGVRVGARANERGGSDTWGWVIEQCASLNDAGFLYRIGYDPSSRA